MLFKSLLRLNAILSFLLFPLTGIGQENDIEMADAMRSNGKIYVVVAVLSVILAGTIIFLIMIDRKVKRLENQRKGNDR